MKYVEKRKILESVLRLETLELQELHFLVLMVSALEQSWFIQMLIFGGADGLLILTYLQELNKQGSSN
jgi:hypothetical protein